MKSQDPVVGADRGGYLVGKVEKEERLKVNFCQQQEFFGRGLGNFHAFLISSFSFGVLFMFLCM